MNGEDEEGIKHEYGYNADNGFKEDEGNAFLPAQVAAVTDHNKNEEKDIAHQDIHIIRQYMRGMAS